jgi:hypothetical protein
MITWVDGHRFFKDYRRFQIGDIDMLSAKISNAGVRSAGVHNQRKSARHFFSGITNNYIVLHNASMHHQFL